MRRQEFADALMQTQHSSQRLRERDYSPEQVYETARHGDEYPNPSRPGTSIFEYDSNGRPNMRRRIVAQVNPPSLITVLPRKPKEQAPAPKPRPTSTKKNQREQKAKKRARSGGQQS